MSDFLTRKIKTYFNQLDGDNDGKISLKDFVEIAERQCDVTKANAVQREKLKACFVKIWRQWMKPAGSDDNGLLTASIFVEAVKQQKNDPEFKEAYMEALKHFFCLLDLNGDGFLQEDECGNAFSDIGFQDADIIHRVFELMDVNGDGKLSLCEFTSAFLEYLTSEDENSPHLLLWGPLVD